ncbi:acidic 27 kDa endochitinase-like [Solanum dulcamara]|uniref:acidic 27 kDa endochitinase-like n=1 Tax=Solanum dulcamara TaxID=45834 RepID=UPI002485483E|nr:acidic 27 kDa endochitinase-like [Solanum dulcamara]
MKLYVSSVAMSCLFFLFLITGTLAQNAGSIVTRDLFEQMLSFRNNDACPAKGFYTYDAFIAAANSFPAFGTTGDDTARKKEMAAFFGQTSLETNGGSAGTYTGGYCFVREGNQVGSGFYGRGPIQLTGQSNYDLAGQAIKEDLVNNPDLVATDATVSFKTAIWFWMTAQGNKPSCHSVITGQWTPSATDMSANRQPGYGVITNIINGGVECNMGQNVRGEGRIGFYKRYCGMLNVPPGENLDCYNQKNFAQA